MNRIVFSYFLCNWNRCICIVKFVVIVILFRVFGKKTFDDISWHFRFDLQFLVGNIFFVLFFIIFLFVAKANKKTAQCLACRCLGQGLLEHKDTVSPTCEEYKLARNDSWLKNFEYTFWCLQLTWMRSKNELQSWIIEKKEILMHLEVKNNEKLAIKSWKD